MDIDVIDGIRKMFGNSAEFAKICKLPSPIGEFIEFDGRPTSIEMLQSFDLYQNVVNLVDRQIGGTTAMCIFALHGALFRKDCNILYCSSSIECAKSAIVLILNIFELLPSSYSKYIPTIVSKSRNELVFDNGSVIRTSVNTPKGTFDVVLFDDFENFEVADQSSSLVAVSLAENRGVKCIVNSAMTKSDTPLRGLHAESIKIHSKWACIDHRKPVQAEYDIRVHQVDLLGADYTVDMAHNIIIDEVIGMLQSLKR